MKLFVYGTLRRGQPAHALLGEATWIADAWTDAAYTFVDAGGYPGLVRGGRTAVRGEIYDVDPAQIEALDHYEDAPALYERAWIAVEGHDVMTYILRPEHAVGMPELPSGDFCVERSSSKRS